MAISFVAASAVVTGANPTVAVPAGTTKNDLLLLVTTGTATPTTPAGWTQLAAQGASQFITVLYKYAAATEASVAVTLVGTTSKAVMTAYRGAGAFQVSATFLTGTSTAPTTNTTTTTYANDFVVSIYANLAGAARTFTANASTTSRVNSATTTTINGLLIASELQVAAGATTARAATLSLSSAWSGLQIAFIESRTVYWVGGNGTWSTPVAGTTGANWANSSGGAGGVIIPTQNDAVVVNGSSGSPTITLSAVPACASLTTTGATCTLSSTGTLQLNGSMTLSATTTWSATGTMTILGTGTVTTNAVSLASPITIDGVSQTVTLGSALSSTGIMDFNNGTLVLNGFDADVLIFRGSGTTARGITFGANFVNITSTATATVLSVATATLFTPSGAGGFKLTGAAASGITRTVAIGTTGGAVATAPNVFVAAGAAGSIVTMTTNGWVSNLDTTGFSGTLTPNSLSLAGSLTFASSTTVGTSALTFTSTSSGNTITTAGKTLSSFTFNGVGGAWTLQDNVTLSGAITLTNGSLTTNNKTINATVFSSSNSNVRTLNLGSSTINLSITTTPWNFATTTNLTFNAGTSQINTTGVSSIEFQGGGLTYYNLNININSISYQIFGNNTFNTLSCDTLTDSPRDLILTGTTQTVTNFNVDGSSYTVYVILTGGTLSKSSGTASLSYAKIDTAATGGATWNAFGCQQQSAAATGWNFGTQTRYLRGSGAINGFNTANRWSTTSGGASNAMFPWQFDDVLFDANSGSVTFTIDESTASIKSLNTTGFTGTLATDLATSNAPDLFIYGNFIVGSSTTFTSGTPSFVLHLSGTSSGNVLTMGSSNKDLDGDITLNCASGSYTITTDIQANALNLILGTLSFGSNTVSFESIDDSSSTGVITLNLNSSTVNLNPPGISNYLDIRDANTTLNSGTSTINLNTFNALGQAFQSSKTFNIVNLNGPTSGSVIEFSSSPTISRLTSSSTVGGYTLEFSSASTTTIGQFDIRGTAGNLVTVTNSLSSNATLASLGSAVQSNIDYISFNSITATPTPTATGTVPYYWYVGANSTQDTTTTTGLVFSSDASYTYYNLTSGTSWSVPANWNNSDNNVYLIGGGGGGSGSVVASSSGSHNSGSGGGGGGFTALTNTTLTAGGTVSYAIGAAGANGTGSTSASTAGGGGTTTFNISNTAGGGGGAATGLGTRTAGTAGTGSTFNGGTGGLGTAPGTNTTNAGGGGAGSGGLDGAGVNGGANSGATIGAGGAGNNNLGDYLFVSGAQYGDGGNGGATAGAGVAATGRGGGGGGGGTTAGSATTRAGGLGTQGVIVVRYRTGTLAGTGNFLTFFYR
jgi:hypothetical protein